jgi:ABC-type multidrug transport system fused ATPase/permease subunit
VQDASAPLDQLAALDQTEAPIPPVTQIEGMENPRYDAPLPPLPPNAVNDSNATLKINDRHLTPAQAPVDEIGFGPVTCTIQPGEKIAVVGQSKSGKSTFVQSLFRVWETAEEERIRAGHAPSSGNNSKNNKKNKTANGATTPVRHHDIDLGTIKVDGLDIEQIGLGDLRSRFAYLSQRGTIFAGTVRFNLDPRGEHEDAALNDILKTCHLSDRLKLETELVTPATARLTSVTGPLSAADAPVQQRPSRLSRYKKKFFRRSRARVNNKGKGKSSGSKDYRNVASAPATVSASSGRGLLAALEGGTANFSEVEQRLMSLEDGQEDDGPLESDTDDEEEEDDGRVELDTNEKQLLSLARILVQRPNVVVMDAAASKVTDLTAQRMDQIMVQELKHATILSVSHRLDHIVTRHNRIVVLDHGKVVEFGKSRMFLS